MDNLMSIVDNTLAIYGTTRYEPWEILSHARTHISDQMGELETTKDLFDTYHTLGQIQTYLMVHCVNECQMEHISLNRQESYICRNPTVAFCSSCGEEICMNHLERKNGATVCRNCEMF